MGIYALTGGATGIGAAIKQQLIEAGHQLISIDIRDADIIADLSSPEGRKTAIDSVRQAAPGGLDGLITCAGLGANVNDSALIASVNYFGTVVLATELAQWVARKQGSIVLISSNSAPMATDNHLIDQFLAGVRFRRALSDTFDTLFILASIGVGISAGVKSIEIAIVLTVFFNYAAIGVCAFGDGLESQYVVQKKIRRKIAKAAKAQEKQARSDPNSSMSNL